MGYDLSYYENCFAEMQEMFNLPDEIFFELNDAFFDIAPQQISFLRTALIVKDFDQIIVHSHTLKGSSASLRHNTISVIAAEIEKNAKEGTDYPYAKAIFELSEEIARIRSQYIHWKSDLEKKALSKSANPS